MKIKDTTDKEILALWKEERRAKFIDNMAKTPEEVEMLRRRKRNGRR